jgi:hypothetical protein
MKETDLLGIVGNTLVIGPFYGGDSEHQVTINQSTKDDLIERGVPEYSDYSYIMAILYSVSHEEYMSWKSEPLLEETPIDCSTDNGLPF